MIGVNFAKTFSYLWEKPLIGIHHIEGHIYANFVGISNDQFPISKQIQNSNFQIKNIQNENGSVSKIENCELIIENSLSVKFPILS